MHVIGHHRPSEQAISLTLEMLQRVLHKGGDFRQFQQAFAMGFMQCGFEKCLLMDRQFRADGNQSFQRTAGSAMGG